MRQCIFCNRPAATKEDAWPVWLVEQVGRSGMVATVSGPDGRAPYRTDRIVQRAGCVCGDCNNGWMSDLEQLTKPLLSPMVDDVSFNLSGDSQAIVAGWMLKTFMVFDWLNGGEYWRFEERAFLQQRQIGRALRGCDTYAASYTGSYKALAYPRHQTVTRPGGINTGIAMFSGVLAVGKVLLYLQTNRYEETTGRTAWLFPPKHLGLMTQLGDGTSQSIQWPRPHTFDDVTLEEFLDGGEGK